MSSMPGKPDGNHLETATLYALQALSANEAAVFEEHLTTYSECRKELEMLRPIIGSFTSWPTDILRPTASLWNRLSQRIADESGGGPIPQPATTTAKSKWPAKAEWKEVAKGIFCRMLAADPVGNRVTMLVRMDPGAEYPPHRHDGFEELHLLHGDLMIGNKKLSAGDFVRAEAGSVDPRSWTETGCTCFLVTSTKNMLI